MKKRMKMHPLIEYMKIHEISLLQDAEKLNNIFNTYEGDYDTDEYREYEVADIINTGELIATRHLLSVAEDMIE
jgi:hypothetical protein